MKETDEERFGHTCIVMFTPCIIVTACVAFSRLQQEYIRGGKVTSDKYPPRSWFTSNDGPAVFCYTGPRLKQPLFNRNDDADDEATRQQHTKAIICPPLLFRTSTDPRGPPSRPTPLSARSVAPAIRR